MQNKYILISLFIIASSTYPMENNKTPKERYNCEELMSQFYYFNSSKREMNTTLKKILPLADKYECFKRKMVSLICFGANPNEIGEWQTYSFPTPQKNLLVTRHHIRPLEVAVETDDAPLVESLLNHGVKTNIDRMNWWKDKHNKFKNLFLWNQYQPITAKKDPLLFRIKSIEVAKLLVPHIGADTKDADGNTVIHAKIASNNYELLRHYSETANTNLIDTTNNNGDLPLHLLAAECSQYRNNDPIKLNEAKLLIANTYDIYALNNNGETPHDIAIKRSRTIHNQVGCNEFITLFKEYGEQFRQARIILSSYDE